MKKIILLSAVLATSLVAEMTTEVIKDAVISKAKSEVTKAVVEKVSGSSDAVKDIAVEVKSAVEDTNNSSSVTSSLKDKAVDMALEKVVGSDTIKKEVAREVVDSAMN